MDLSIKKGKLYQPGIGRSGLSFPGHAMTSEQKLEIKQRAEQTFAEEHTVRERVEICSSVPYDSKRYPPSECENG